MLTICSKNIDNNAISCKSDVAVANHVWSFATQYKNYMDQLFDGDAAWSINLGVRNAKDFMLEQIEQDFPENSELTVPGEPEQQELEQWRARVADLRAANWQVTMTWDWPEVEARDVDDESGPACALPTASATVSSFYTSIISETRTEGSQTIETTYEGTATSNLAEITSTLDYTTEQPTEEATSLTEAFSTTEQPTDEATSLTEEFTATEIESPTTATAEPEPIETTPLEQKPPICNNADDFKGHATIVEHRIKGASLEFCIKMLLPENEKLYPGQKIDELVVDTNYVRYRFLIEWIEGCHVSLDQESDWQYTYSPTSTEAGGRSPMCFDLFLGAWKDCKYTLITQKPIMTANSRPI